jgi:hypothetical protein
MEKIYSKTNPDVLLHVVFRFQDFNKPRVEISATTDPLQCLAIRANEGDSFGAHYHLYKTRLETYEKTQECMVVIRGLIECSLYDTDNSLLGNIVLKEGEALYTLAGGHGFVVLEDHSCMLEFKSGPYMGQKNDKVYIHE